MLSVVAEHLDGVLEIETSVYSDHRGRFAELGRRSELEAIGLPEFVQMNQSLSHHNVLRGIHYQLPPSPQGKLVGVSLGTVWDVAVDLRSSSPTFLEWVGVTLTDERCNMVYIPPGFGHGFVALTEPAVVLYRTTAVFDPDADRSIRFDDPAIGIEWPRPDGEWIVSDKDQSAPSAGEAQLFDQ